MRRSGAGVHDIHLPGEVSPPPDLIWLLRGLIALGFAALLYGLYRIVIVFGGDAYAATSSPLILTVAILTLAYFFGQILGGWYLYLKARRRPAPPSPVRAFAHPPSVDVFVTACGEPADMVARVLTAACAMRGTHQTWLLDDGHDPELARLADRLGAGYLTRDDRTDAKAGNVNAALARTRGEIVAIFDVDHVPELDFLERSLGHFADPEVGFVQVMVTFSNGEDRWIAHAALETSLDFYNPVSMGMDALGSVTMMGSNALIRRKALDSIGGYHSGLAEDLATSLALHAEGWRSAYVAEPLAPGLAPEDIASWFTQQMKWARGVFEVLLVDYPRVFGKLTWGQRLCYAVRMTNYWIGPLCLAYLATAVSVMVSVSPLAAFQRYLLDLLPLTLCYIVIRPVAIAAHRHPSVVPRPLWRAVALVYFTWPIYTMAWLMAVLRLRLAFRPTPKEATGSIHPAWLFPQLLGMLCLALGAGTMLSAGGHCADTVARYPLVLAFAAVQCLLPLIVLVQRLNRHRLQGIRDARKRIRSQQMGQLDHS